MTQRTLFDAPLRVTKVFQDGGFGAEAIDVIFDRIAEYPLRADLAPYAGRASDSGCARHGLPLGSTDFMFAFEGAGGVFRIVTNDPSVCDRFTAAIAQNVGSAAYRDAKADWERSCLCAVCQPEWRNASECRRGSGA